MRKYALLLLLGFLITNFVFGQEDFSVKFSNGDYSPQKIQESKRTESSIKEQLSGKRYQLLQFYNLPGEKEVKALKETGIELVDYIPKNTYTAIIDTQKLKESKSLKFDQTNLRAHFSLPKKYKIDSRLTAGKLPEWTEPEFGKAEVNVLLYRDYDIEAFRNYVNKWNIEIIKVSTYSNRIQLKTAVQYLGQIAEWPAVKWVEPIEPQKEMINDEASKNHRTNVLKATYDGARGLTGEGVVVGEWDGGKIGDHQDLYGRVENTSSEQEHWHSTHVAGTILGKGILDPKGEGMAKDAQLFASDFMKDADAIAEDMSNSVSSHSVDITSNSWGYSIDQYICKNPFPYITAAKYYDDVAYQHKKLTHVFANGNDQQVCPGGYWTSAWTMKNTILVGAVDDTSNMSNFSSFGPLFDGRMAPHVSGVGVDIYSTFLDNYYYSSDGTSMATPAVSGAIALMYERYEELKNEQPTSALIRSVLFNTADDIGNKGPDYKFGFGKVNLRKAIETIENENYFSDKVSNNSNKTYNIEVPSNAKKLKVTVAWTDQSGTPFAAIPLVNDIDLLLSKDNDTWLPWVLDKDNPSAPAQRGEDHISNFEQVTIDNPGEGQYAINIQGEEISAFMGMPFVVSYQIDTPEVTVTHPVGGETLIAGENGYIRWDAPDTSKSFSIDISTNGGQSWSSVVSDLPGTKRYFEFAVPDTFTSNALIRVNQDGISGESQAPFSIMGTPDDFRAVEQFEAVDLLWDSVPGATSYEIYEAVNGELNLLGNTADTTFHIDELETGNKYWLTIKPVREEDNITGERMKAISPTPIPQYDFGVSQITEPVSSINMSSAEEISAEIVNYGANVLHAGDTMTLAYSINEGGVIEENVVLDADLEREDTLSYTFEQTAYMATYDDYEIKVWTEHPLDTFYTDNDSKTKSVTNSEPVTEYPYLENFDGFANLMISSADDPVYLSNNWHNDHVNDDIEWWPNSGKTYVDGTGPNEDHTSGEGKYLYTEAFVLEGEPGEAYLYSPGFNISQLEDPALFFWYHLYAKDFEMGTLHVDLYSVQNDTVFEDIAPVISGSQGKEWHRQMISLKSYKDEGVFRIRFRAEITDHEQNAFAIDDVKVTELYENNFGIIGMSPKTDSSYFTENEPISVSLVNISPDTITAGTEIPVGYQYENNAPVEETISLSEELHPFDTLDYNFTQTADLSDLTKRYEFTSWVAFPDDNHSYNDTLSDYYAQSYCEPRSNCYSGGTPTGIGTFILEGIHEQFDINNSNSLCGSTDAKGYSYHGDQMAKLYTGSEFQMQIRAIVPPPDLGIPIMGEFFKIWIDFDQSGSFEKDELVYANEQRDIDLLTDTIEIPADAAEGKTRMRVRSSYYQEDLISPTQSCSPIGHGETEDYSVEILSYPDIDLNSESLTELPVTKPGLSSAEQIGLKVVSLGNNQIEAGTEIPYAYRVNDHDIVRESFVLDNALQKGDTASFVFNNAIDMSSIGEYKIKLWNEKQDDEDPWNDTLMTRIHHMEKFDGNDYEESFENGTAGWFDESLNWQPVWEKGTPSQDKIANAFDGNNVWMTSLDENYPHESEMILHTPAFDFSGMEKPMISFWMHLRTEFNWDGMIMEASTDGYDWTKIGAEEGLDFYNNKETNNPQWELGTPWWSGNNGGWNKYEFVVDEYSDKSNVMFRFRFKSDLYENDEGVAIDEFTITEKIVDLGITEYLGPKDFDELTSRENIKFKFANLGTTTFLNSESVKFEIWVNNNLEEFNHQFTSDVFPGDTIVYKTPVSFDMTQEESYKIEIRATYDGDDNPSNNEYIHELGDQETGLENPDSDFDINVFPNPSNGMFILELKAQSSENFNVEIYNDSGVKIRDRKIKDQSSGNLQFDLMDVDPGIYLIKVNNGHTTNTKRVMIK